MVIPYTSRSSLPSGLGDMEVIQCSSINQVLERVLGKSYLAIAKSKNKAQDDVEDDNF